MEKVSRVTLVFAAAVLLVSVAIGHAQSPAEQAELDADAGQRGPFPQGQEGTFPQGQNGILECGPGTIPSVVYFSDFEADNGGFTGGGAAPWEHGPPVLGVFENCDTVPEDEPPGAFSGVNVWATNLNGCYTNSGSASSVSRTFDFSSLAAPIQLSWWNWYEVFVPFDMAQLFVNGSPLFEVTTTTPTPDYVQEIVDLSAFAGNPSVTIDFQLFATTVVNRAGWYFDDVRIEYCEAVEADIPTLGAGGLALLALLMAGGAALLLRCRRA